MVGKIVGFAPNQRYFLDGKQVSKRVFEKAFPPKPMAAGGECSLSSVPANVSNSLAVHPKRAREFQEDAKKKGCPTEFKADGSPVFTSRAHQAKYCKLYGFRPRSSYY